MEDIIKQLQILSKESQQSISGRYLQCAMTILVMTYNYLQRYK